MARGFNYAKANLQKRVDREQWLSGSVQWRQPKAFLKQRVKWQLLSGRFAGMTLPELVVKMPGEFIKLYYYDSLFEPLLWPKLAPERAILAHQLEAIKNRAQHILVPHSYRGSSEFVTIVDSEGVFECIELVPKGGQPDYLDRGSGIVARSSEFDLATPLFYREPECGMKRLARSLRKIFFDGRNPTAWQCQKFYFTPSNFNLSQCSSHISMQENAADHTELKAKYYNYCNEAAN